MLISLIHNGESLTPDLPDAPVPWWSFTKTVIAAAALTLVRDALITLDDVVLEGPFTLRQLLKHQAGLADYGELSEYHAAVAGADTPWAADDMLRRLDASRLRYAPGAGWQYSNVGYLYAGRLIERVTALSLADALAERVFSPLGITGVRLARTAQEMTGLYPESLRTYDPGWVYHGLLVGPLGQASLLLDRLMAGRLIPSDLSIQMLDAIVLGGPMQGRPWATPGYGLGLMIGEADTGQRLAGHTGVGPGAVLAVYHCRQGEDSATCAVFSEGADEGAIEREAARLLQQILGAGHA